MAIDSQNTITVFSDHIASFIEAEHAGCISIVAGFVQDLRLIDPLGECFPDFIWQLDTYTDIHLVVCAGNMIVFTPLLEHAVADSAYGKDNRLSFDVFFLPLLGKDDIMAFFIHVTDHSLGFNIHMTIHGMNQFEHRAIVGISAKMFDFCLLHMQVMLETQCLQLIVRMVDFLVCAIAHQNLICLADVFHDILSLHDIRQPAAVFGRDVVLAIRECTSTCHTFHDGTRIALDALFNLASQNRAASVFKLSASFQNQHAQLRTFLHQTVGAHQAADTAANNDNIINIFHLQYVLLLLSLFDFFLFQRHHALSCL